MVEKRGSVVVGEFVEGVLGCVEGSAGSGLDEQVIARDVEGLGELHDDVG